MHQGDGNRDRGGLHGGDICVMSSHRSLRFTRAQNSHVSPSGSEVRQCWALCDDARQLANVPVRNCTKLNGPFCYKFLYVFLKQFFPDRRDSIESLVSPTGQTALPSPSL